MWVIWEKTRARRANESLNGAPIYQGSFVYFQIRWQEYDTTQMILGILKHHGLSFTHLLLSFTSKTSLVKNESSFRKNLSTPVFFFLRLLSFLPGQSPWSRIFLWFSDHSGCSPLAGIGGSRWPVASGGPGQWFDTMGGNQAIIAGTGGPQAWHQAIPSSYQAKSCYLESE